MENNNFYKSIFEHSPVGYSYNRIIYDDNGEAKDYEFIEVNKAYESMLGIEAKDLIGKRVSQVYGSTKKQKTSWNEFYSKLISKHNKNNFEYCFEFINKYYRVKSHRPEKDYIIISLIDISAEIEERKKLEMLSDNVPIQVWYLDDPETYVSANKAHADFIGFERDELIFKNIKDLFRLEDAESCIEGNEEVFQQKKEIVLEKWRYNYHGEKRLLRINKNPKLNEKNEVEFIVCSAEDITEEYINKEEKKIKERILYSSIEFTQELLTNENLSSALSNGIDMLGNATQVDRVYYWENHYDEDSQKWFSSQRYEWCLDDIEQQIDNPKLQNVPFEESIDLIGTLSANKTFSSHIKDMAYGKNSTKQSLKAQGILSILAIPVFIRGEFSGFIGFDSCKVEKEWSQVEISLLNSFVLLYVKAVERNLLKESVVQSEENLYNFFNMIQDLLFVLDFEGNIVDINNNVLEKFNYSREELLGEQVLMLHPEDKIEEVQENIADLVAGKIEYCDIPAITRDGHIFPIETRTSEGLWNGEPVIFGVSKDISELRMSEEKFSKAFNNSGISMFISKFSNGELLEVNDTFLDYFGYTKDEIIGKSTLDLNIMTKLGDRDIMKKNIKSYNKISDMEIKVISKDNVTRTGLANIVPLNINNEKYLLSSIIDITDRIKYEKKLLELSNKCPLTNIFNRRYVYHRLEEITEEYKRNNNIFSACIIDIDNFKAINDGYGHQAGDYVLKRFSKIINDNLRLYDILGRYGGDEFIVVLRHSNINESNIVLERISNIVKNKTFKFKENKIKLSFSAGISSSEELGKDKIEIEELIEMADKRMYIAKKNGKKGIIYT